MKTKLLGAMFALLLAAPAAAEPREVRPPDLRRDTHPPITEMMMGSDCNAGGPASLVVALATLGLVTRRRRE